MEHPWKGALRAAGAGCGDSFPSHGTAAAGTRRLKGLCRGRETSWDHRRVRRPPPISEAAAVEGATAVLAILACGVYLAVRRTANWGAAAVFLAVCAV